MYLINITCLTKSVVGKGWMWGGGGDGGGVIMSNYIIWAIGCSNSSPILLDSGRSQTLLHPFLT